MDIYTPYFNPNACDKKTVNIGRLSASAALIIAMIIAPMLANGRGIFNVIQEYTAVVSPGILAVFILGLFYKKANNSGAIYGILFSIAFALGLKFSGLGLPWMHETGLVFVATCLVIALVSYFTGKGVNDQKAIQINGDTFSTTSSFNIASFVILMLIAVIYAMFW